MNEATTPAAAEPTVRLIPNRDLAWGSKTLKKDKPFDFPVDVEQALFDAEVVTRASAEVPSAVDAAEVTPAATTGKASK